MTGSILQIQFGSIMNRVVFFGGDGGCLDAFFLACELYEIEEKIVLSDDKSKVPLGAKWGGGFDSCPEFKGCHFVFQCGNVTNHGQRHVWFEFAKKSGLIPLTCISQHAYVHHTAIVGLGSIVYPGTQILTNVKLGDNVVILPNSTVNHDCDIGSFTLINSNCSLNGNIKCGRNSFIGSGSNIREKCSIAAYSTIGIGSLVLESIDEMGLYYGAPARKH